MSAFGLHLKILEERYFPNGVAARSADVVAKVLVEREGDVLVQLRSVKVDPASITEEAAPSSYGWIQTTILVGAAAEAVRRTSGDVAVELADAWWGQYETRLRQLRDDKATVLTDLPGQGSTSRAAFNWV